MFKIQLLSFTSILFLLASCGNSSTASEADSPKVRTTSSPALRNANISNTAIVSTKILNYTRQSGGSSYGSRKEGQQHDVLLDTIEDVFTQEILGKGYRYASRAEIQSVINELNFQNSGLTDSDAAAIGKILNLPAVFVLNVTQLGTVDDSSNSVASFSLELASFLIIPTDSTLGCSMTARLISTETSEVLWIGRVSNVRLKQASRKDLAPVLEKAAKVLAESIPPAVRNSLPPSVPAPLSRAVLAPSYPAYPAPADSARVIPPAAVRVPARATVPVTPPVAVPVNPSSL